MKHLFIQMWSQKTFHILFILFYFIYLFIYLFLAVLGLGFCARAFSSCGKRGPLFIAVRGPLTIMWPLLLRSTGSRCAGSVVVAHRPSCSTACGIFPDQGSNPCPLHQQADSQPLHHQGSLTLPLNSLIFIEPSQTFLECFNCIRIILLFLFVLYPQCLMLIY